MSTTPTDKFTLLMQFAALVAWKGQGHVEPNPMVGAVLINNGKVIGHGYHKEFGGPHAEIEAIKMAKERGESLKNAMLIVTLEPCTHQGKTPPCTKTILKEKIDAVLYGEIDGNPKVNGLGIEKLKKAGVMVMEWSIRETRDLYKLYNHQFTEKKRPYIHLKTACTPSGEITLKPGERTILSGRGSTKYIHELRAQYDGIMVGSGTVETDNPKLTVRHVKGKNPVRIILDSEQKLSPKSAVFHQPGETLWVTTKLIDPEEPLPKGTRVMLVRAQEGTKRIDLKDLMDKLLERNIRTLLVEGGETLNTELLKKNMVDEVSLCISGKSLPKRSTDLKLPHLYRKAFQLAFRMKECQLKSRGNDLWIEGKPGFNLLS